MKTNILLALALFCLPVSGQTMDRAEYVRQNALCWEQMKIEFPQWATGAGKRAAMAWMKDYDKWAKAKNPAMLADPWRPLWYARARAEDIRKAEAVKTAAPVWKKFVQNEAFQEANKEAIAEEIRRSEGDEAAARYTEAAAEKRLRAAEERAEEIARKVRKLEQAERDAERMRHNDEALKRLRK